MELAGIPQVNHQIVIAVGVDVQIDGHARRGSAAVLAAPFDGCSEELRLMDVAVLRRTDVHLDRSRTLGRRALHHLHARYRKG